MVKHSSYLPWYHKQGIITEVDFLKYPEERLSFPFPFWVLNYLSAKIWWEEDDQSPKFDFLW